METETGISTNVMLVFGIDLGEDCFVMDEYKEVSILEHGSGDFPKCIISVPGTKTDCQLGDLKSIDREKLTVSNEKIEAFKKWCKSHDIKDPEPQWLICSYWG